MTKGTTAPHHRAGSWWGIRNLGTALPFLPATRPWLEAGIRPSGRGMRLLPAAASKLAPRPCSRHGLHNAAYESEIARPCQPVGRPGWGGKRGKNKYTKRLCSPLALLPQQMQLSCTISARKGGKEQGGRRHRRGNGPSPPARMKICSPGVPSRVSGHGFRPQFPELFLPRQAPIEANPGVLCVQGPCFVFKPSASPAHHELLRSPGAGGELQGVAWGWGNSAINSSASNGLHQLVCIFPFTSPHAFHGY